MKYNHNSDDVLRVYLLSYRTPYLENKRNAFLPWMTVCGPHTYIVAVLLLLPIYFYGVWRTGCKQAIQFQCTCKFQGSEYGFSFRFLNKWWTCSNQLSFIAAQICLSIVTWIMLSSYFMLTFQVSTSPFFFNSDFYPQFLFYFNCAHLLASEFY